jgi:hypothetical protein
MDAYSSPERSRPMGIKWVRHAVGLAALVSLSACGGASAVTGPFKVGAAYTVTLGKTWSSVPRLNLNREVKYLTIDGPLLNNFYLTEGLAVGRSVVRTTQKSRPMPIVRPNMTETEMVEFVVDTVAAFGYEGVNSADLRPGRFGSVEGVRFDLTAKTDEGLNLSGTAQVAEVNGKIHVMLFVAPSEHYYQALKPEIDAVFASATLRP